MKNISKELKLTIELVPETSWGNNIRKCVSQSNWDKIRKAAYAKYKYKCGICEAPGRLSCHEIWDYDDELHVQNLNGFIALCTMCHNIKHIGLSGILAQEGKLDFDKLIEHFKIVNGCNLKTYEKHYDDAFKKWNERSKHEWHINLGEFKDIIKKEM